MPDTIPAGIPSENNAHESYNREVKRAHVLGDELTTLQHELFESTIPSILEHAGEWNERSFASVLRNISNQKAELQKPIPGGMLIKASHIKETANSHYATIGQSEHGFPRAHQNSIFINAKKCANRPVTLERVQRFIDGKDHSMQDANDPCLAESLRTFFDQVIQQGPGRQHLEEISTFDQLAEVLTTLHEVVRNIEAEAAELAVQEDGADLDLWWYKCDCKNFYFNGFICSHVLFAFDRDGTINLESLVGKWVQGGSHKIGRPPKRPFGELGAIETHGSASTDTWRIHKNTTVHFPADPYVKKYGLGVVKNYVPTAERPWYVWFPTAGLKSGADYCDYCSVGSLCRQRGAKHLYFTDAEIDIGKASIVDIEEA